VVANQAAKGGVSGASHQKNVTAVVNAEVVADDDVPAGDRARET
jgi:hypothetical protein